MSLYSTLDLLSLGYVVAKRERGSNELLLVYSVQKEFSKSSQLSCGRLALFVQSKVVLSEMLNLLLEHSLVLLLLSQVILKLSKNELQLIHLTSEKGWRTIP